MGSGIARSRSSSTSADPPTRVASTSPREPLDDELTLPPVDAGNHGFDLSVWCSVISVTPAAKVGIWAVSCSDEAKASERTTETWLAKEVFTNKLSVYARSTGVLTSPGILLIESDELRRLIKSLKGARVRWMTSDFPEDMEPFVHHSKEIAAALERNYRAARKQTK